VWAFIHQGKWMERMITICHRVMGFPGTGCGGKMIQIHEAADELNHHAGQSCSEGIHFLRSEFSDRRKVIFFITNWASVKFQIAQRTL
jgi:hypothetical protein